MKHFSKYYTSLLLSLALLGISFLAYSQDRKYKARVSAQYDRVMNKESFIGISAKFKMESGFEPASDVEFNIYRTGPQDSLLFLGKTKTNEQGKAKFVLNDKDISTANATTEFSYSVKIENNDRFDDNETVITFSVANLSTEIQTIDSVNQIKATLTDASGNPLKGQPLKVRLQRMYAPLQVGDESYETDESGSVILPIKEPMPGIDGNLTFEVVLEESDLYGTVTAIATAPIGIPIGEKSTFDQRTLWSPPAKTPLYLLIFPSIIILSVWGPILLLVFNLYKISKSKTNSL